MNEPLLASTSLWLASKFYEIDENLIMVSDLQDEFRKDKTQRIRLKSYEVYRTEIEILKRLEWNLY